MNEGNKGASIWDTFVRQPGEKLTLKKNHYSKCFCIIYEKIMFCASASNLSHFFDMKIGRILDFSNGDMAVDQYHRFQVNQIDTFVFLF